LAGPAAAEKRQAGRLRSMLNAAGVALLLPGALLIWNTIDLVRSYQPDKCGSCGLARPRKTARCFIFGLADPCCRGVFNHTARPAVPAGVRRGFCDCREAPGVIPDLRHLQRR